MYLVAIFGSILYRWERGISPLKVRLATGLKQQRWDVHRSAEVSFVVRISNDWQAVWTRHSVSTLALEKSNVVLVIDCCPSHCSLDLSWKEYLKKVGYKGAMHMTYQNNAIDSFLNQ